MRCFFSARRSFSHAFDAGRIRRRLVAGRLVVFRRLGLSWVVAALDRHSPARQISRRATATEYIRRAGEMPGSEEIAAEVSARMHEPAYYLMIRHFQQPARLASAVPSRRPADNGMTIKIMPMARGADEAACHI